MVVDYLRVIAMCLVECMQWQTLRQVLVSINGASYGDVDRWRKVLVFTMLGFQGIVPFMYKSRSMSSVGLICNLKF